MKEDVEFKTVLDFLEQEVSIKIDKNSTSSLVKYRVILEGEDITDQLLGEDAIQAYNAANEYMEKHYENTITV